jgi:EmrB/QacA subfamily drug resistance transporter
MNVPALDPYRWRALALVGAAFLMTVLDATIVNVALPTIQEKLNFSQENLQWVVTAYAITFGGFLLLGGRLADLLGRRRMFFIGVTFFTLASLACGLASNETFLIVMRGIQGLGGAIISPAALSIVSQAFPEGAERNRALGVWGALGGSGAAIGVLLGGLLTKYLGWEWIFYVNIPIGALVLALTPFLVRESRVEVAQKRYDPLGAITITASIILIVYSISKAPSVGWGSGRTIGLLVAGIVLLLAFLAIESRVKDALMPLSIFRIRTVSGANIVGLALGALILVMFFLLTLYVQQVLHYSPLKTGITFLVTAGLGIVTAGAAEALVTRVGPKPVLAIGLACMGGAMFYFTGIDVNGSFASDLLPGYILAGIGLGFSFVPVSIAALAGVSESQYGLASGLINTSQQIGGALGLAAATTLFTTRLVHELPGLIQKGTNPALAQEIAMTNGFHLAFWVFGGVAFAAAGLALLVLRGTKIEVEHPSESIAIASPHGCAPSRVATAHLSRALLGGDAPERPGAVPS